MKGTTMSIAIWTVAVVLGLVAVGLVLPDEMRTSRSLVIAVRPEAIHPHIASLRDWPRWSIWNRTTDPTVTFNFEGAASGVGAAWSWQGEKFEKGRLEIVASDPTKGIAYVVAFSGFRVDGSMSFEEEIGGTRVIWSDHTSFRMGPLGGWMKLFLSRAIDRHVAGNMEKSLAGLKQLVEGDSPSGVDGIPGRQNSPSSFR